MDATGCAGHAQAAVPGVQWCPAATLLLGIPGLVVTAAAQDDDSWLSVDVMTHPDLREQARQCPGCGARANIKDWVITTPRDLPPGDRKIRPRWRSRRCPSPSVMIRRVRG